MPDLAINPATPNDTQPSQAAESKERETENNSQSKLGSNNKVEVDKSGNVCIGGQCWPADSATAKQIRKDLGNKVKHDEIINKFLGSIMPGNNVDLDSDKKPQSKDIEKSKEQTGQERDGSKTETAKPKAAINSATDAFKNAGAKAVDPIDSMSPSELFDEFKQIREEGIAGKDSKSQAKNSEAYKIPEISMEALKNSDGSLNTNDPRVRSLLKAGGLKDSQIDNTNTVYEVSKEANKSTIKFYSNNGPNNIRSGKISFDHTKLGENKDFSLSGSVFNALDSKESAQLKGIQAAKSKSVDKIGGKEIYLQQQKLAAKADIAHKLLKAGNAKNSEEIGKIASEVSNIGNSGLKKDQVVKKLKELDAKLSTELKKENGKLESLAAFTSYLTANDLMSKERDKLLDLSADGLKKALSDGKIDSGEEKLDSDLNSLLDKLLGETASERNKLTNEEQKEFDKSIKEFNEIYSKIKSIDSSKIKSPQLKDVAKRIKNMQTLQKSFDRHFKAEGSKGDKQFLGEVQHLTQLIKNLEKAEGFNKAIEEAKKPPPSQNNNELKAEFKKPNYQLSMNGTDKASLDAFIKQSEKFLKDNPNSDLKQSIENVQKDYKKYSQLSAKQKTDLALGASKIASKHKVTELEKALTDRLKKVNKIPESNKALKKLYEDTKKKVDAIKPPQGEGDLFRLAELDKVIKDFNRGLKSIPDSKPDNNPNPPNPNQENKANFAGIQDSNIKSEHKDQGKNLNILNVTGAGKETFEKIKAEADKSGKKTNFVISTEWCGPCQAKEAAAKSGRLQEQKDANLVILKVKQSYKSDFLSGFGRQVTSFPTTISYDPSTKRFS